MKTNDVFSDEVMINRPPFIECVGIGAIANSSDVVGKCIEPHVGNM